MTESQGFNNCIYQSEIYNILENNKFNIATIMFSSKISSRRRPLFYLPSITMEIVIFYVLYPTLHFPMVNRRLYLTQLSGFCQVQSDFLSLKRRQNIYRRDKVEIPGVSQMTHFVLPSFISTLCMYKETRMKIYVYGKSLRQF